MTAGIRAAGDFCWVNIITPQPAESCAFFSTLLGWRCTEMPGMGFGLSVGGHDFGALFDLHAPNTPAGTLPLVGVMIKVDNADAFCERVRAAGGRAGTPFNIMSRLRMAVCHDPSGANFDVWESKSGSGTQVDTAQPGAPVWFDVLSHDMDRDAAFYAETFGWTVQRIPFAERPYIEFRRGGVPVAGMLEHTPEMQTPKPVWLTYFNVADVVAAAAQTVSLGGEVVLPPRLIPGVGSFCGLKSPQGVPFSVINYR